MRTGSASAGFRKALGWRPGKRSRAKALEGHAHAVVILVAFPALPDRDNPARAWVEDAVAATAGMRVLEIAACTAGHIRQMDFEARIHHAGGARLDR